MRHKGAENAIPSKQISAEVGFPMEDTQSVSRKAIWRTAEECGLPLVSCRKGYFIAQNDSEIEAYNKNIQERIDGMERNREMVNRNYREKKNQQSAEKLTSQ